jgi:hypothetical protein
MSEPGLQLSESTRDKYLGIIATYRSALIEQRDRAFEIGRLGSPGSYDSAWGTKTRLELNVYADDGFCAVIDKYIEYLNQFEDTVNASCSRMLAEDQSA